MTDTTAGEADMQKLDVTRAIGVLNAAAKHGMFAEGTMPETDTDKIVEAERLIELAKQQKVVADAIGPANVPKYQAILDVLAEAELFLGINSEPGPASPPAAAPEPERPPLFCGVEDPARAGVTCDKEPNHGGPHMGYGQTWDSFVPADAVAAPSAQEQTPVPSTGAGDASSTADPTPVPAQPATTSPPAEPTGVEHPVPRETWFDASGNQWLVLQGDGGPQYEVQSVATGEKTEVPAGFLVQRAAVAPPEPPAPQEAPPSLSPPSPSSLPQPSSPSSPSLRDGSSPPAQSPVASSGPPASSSEPATPASSSSSSPSASSTEAKAPVDDDEGDPQYLALLEGVENDYEPAAMPVPMDLESPPEGMPEDLTLIGDLEQRRLHSQFNALQARARYLYGLENAKAKRIKRLRKSYMKVAMREARAQLGKDASVTEVTNLAEEHPDVAPWIERQERHEDRAEAYKTFFDTYTENVTVLSRDWTMRDSEHQSS